jgi:hypothetical protein
MADILPLMIILAVVAGLSGACLRHARKEEADWEAQLPLYSCSAAQPLYGAVRRARR